MVYDLQSLTQKVTYYIKDSNHFLNKIKKIGNLPDETIFSAMDVVYFYLNISHAEGSTSSCDFFETRYNKQISSHSLAELSEIILKDDIFQFDEKFSGKNVEPQLK